MSLFERIIRFLGCLALAVIGFFVIQILIHLIVELLSAQPPVNCSWLCDFVAAISGINCMSCELFAYGMLWLWIIVFALLIIAIIILIIRCLLKVFRHEEEEDEDVTVKIMGVAPLLLYAREGDYGSPVLTLTAEGNPSGGTYEWSITEGNDKVELANGLNDANLRMSPTQQSIERDDIKVKVTYTTEDGSATAEESLTAHTPSSAIRISSVLNPVNGPTYFGYDFVVRYRILDQFDDRFPGGEMFIDEDLIVLVNPYNTPFVEREYMTDANAEYDDHYELTFENTSIPDDYHAEVRQVVRANGVEFLNHIIVWESGGVSFR